MIRKKHYDYCSATISGHFVTIRYIGLSNTGHLTTLRLFYDYFLYNYYAYIHITMNNMQRLFAGKNYDYWLRLFQLERYDYC